MTILIPPPKVAARWNGALQARLRRAPLEAFLRARGLRVAAVGAAQVTDNIVTASVHLVTAALQARSDRGRGLVAQTTLQGVAQSTCAVSDGIASLIDEAAAWRIGALVSAAHVLRKLVGVRTAAHIAAAAARLYASDRSASSPVAHLVQAAHDAVRQNDEAHFLSATGSIAQFLASLGDLTTYAGPAQDFGGAIFNSSTT